jgi:hypothetical protein
MAELYILPKSYNRLEVEAYVQLAGVLIAAERSPCRDADALPSSVNLDIKLVLEQEDDIRWLLTLLTLDKRPRAQRAISRQLINRLPIGQGVVREQVSRRLHAVAIARYLIAVTLLRLRDDGGLDTTTLGFSALSALLLLRQLDANQAATLAAMRGVPVRASKFYSAQDMLNYYEVMQSLPNMDFYRQKGWTLQVVADRMALIESTEVGSTSS